MAVTTQVQGQANPPTKTEPETLRRRGEGEAAGVAAVAFESLLDSTRTLVRAETHRATRVSPTEMFDAPVADGGDHQMASLEEQHRSDRTEARREIEKAPSYGTTHRAINARPLGQQSPTAQPNVPESTRMDAASVQLDVASLEARVVIPPGSQNGVGVQGLTRSPTSQERPSSQQNTAPSRAALPGSTVTGSTGVEAAAASTPNVARQVGELLGATRGSVQSGQGVLSLSAVGDGRSTVTSSKSTVPEAQRTPESRGFTRPSEETAAKEASSFERLVRSIRLQAGTRSSSARLQLHPPELGRLRVDVRLAGDLVEIEVRTETDAARDLVSRRAEELKTALQQHGIQMNRLEVTVHSVSEQYNGTATDDGSAVPPDAQRNPSWAGGQQRSGEERTDDAGSNAATRAASPAEVVAEARLDIRV